MNQRPLRKGLTRSPPRAACHPRRVPRRRGTLPHSRCSLCTIPSLLRCDCTGSQFRRSRSRGSPPLATPASPAPFGSRRASSVRASSSSRIGAAAARAPRTSAHYAPRTTLAASAEGCLQSPPSRHPVTLASGQLHPRGGGPGGTAIDSQGSTRPPFRTGRPTRTPSAWRPTGCFGSWSHTAVRSKSIRWTS